MTMLFNAPCSTGDLQVDAVNVQVVTAFKKVVWSVPRQDVTYIALQKGAVKVDITVFTAQNHYPARFLTKQNANRFVRCFPGVPTGGPLAIQSQQTAGLSMAQNAQWNAAPTVPFHVPPPTKKKPPRWAYILTGIIALVLCGCISTAVIAAIASTNGSQAQVAATPTGTPSNTGQSSTLAATVTSNTPTSVLANTPTAEPTAKPTVRPTPTPVPTRPPAPTPTPKPSCNAINGNPWCYNFSPGTLIYTPPSGFCGYFNCIASFYSSDDPGDGYIIECQDGTYSQSGGERGACSSHGGEMRPLYSH
jgi:hypothetical protein